MGGRRVCFVVSDLLGLVTNSGIGTATSYGALVLAAAGHDVTLVHIRSNAALEPAWQERYKAAGVKIEHVPGVVAAPRYLAESYGVYEHLKDRDFDVIAFQDWMALGWACTQAKHTGVAFAGTHLIHTAHGPEAWLHQANLDVAINADQLGLAHAGRVAAELSDSVVGPSRYLLDWMTSVGWRLPDRQFVVPYFTEAHARAAQGERDAAEPAPAGPVPIRELAFFGRLERRKGVHVFAAALNRLDPALLDGVTVSFVGRDATITKADVRAMLNQQVHRAIAGLDFHTRFDNAEACRHLSRPGTLAIIPSLVDNSPNTVYECIERGIPFLASSSGGTPELVHKQDRGRCMVEPDPEAFAAALVGALTAEDGVSPVRPTFDMAASLAQWEEILAWTPPAPIEVREAPLVTVVVPHHDRPELLLTALVALDGQDYGNLEVVVVDDGSQAAASHDALDQIEARDWAHPFQVVRQENRYLGAARNAGVAAGRGELLAFVDDDDVATPGFVSTLVRTMLRTGAEAVTCAMRSFMLAVGVPARTDSRGSWVFAGGPLHVAAVHNCLGGAPALIRRGAFEAVGGYHERHGVGFEDWHLYVKLLLGGHSLVSVPEPLYWYRIHSNSMRLNMSDYYSAQVIIEEFRAALPPALRGLADLAYGQQQGGEKEIEELKDEVDLRDRLLWLAEERFRERRPRPDVPPSAHAMDAGAFGWDQRDLVGSVRRGLLAGRDRLRQGLATRPSVHE